MHVVRDNIAAMRAYVPGEQPTDPNVVKLNTNENPYPPSPRVMQAIAAITPEQLRRYPSPDAAPFRREAAALHGVAPDMIMATNGGDELLACAARACADARGGIAYTVPSYSLYPVLTDMQGARHVEVPYQVDRADWRMPDDAFDHLSERASLLLITNPNAPSGTLLGRDLLRRAASRFQGLVVIDEAYVNFAASDALPLVREFANVLILRSLSKGYGLAGLRFGYGIGQASLITELEKVRDSYACDAISISAAIAAIGDQDHARQGWRRVIEQRARLVDGLSRMGFAIPESHANFVLANVPPSITGEKLYLALKARDILVRYFDLPHLRDAIRVTVGTAEQNGRLLEETKNIVENL